MDIELPLKLNQWISEKVASGFYRTPDEVILEGLRLLKRREEERSAVIQNLRQEILVGMQQLDAGKSVVFNDSLVKDIKAKGRKKLGL
jgi:putative addiction module CopG family antidote